MVTTGHHTIASASELKGQKLPRPQASLFVRSAVCVVLWACYTRKIGTQPNYQSPRSLFPVLHRRNATVPGHEEEIKRSVWKNIQTDSNILEVR